MKKPSLKKIQKTIELIILLIFIQGCATTITVQYESNPSGAKIYGGKTPVQMKFIGTTPYTETFTGINPSWVTYYYQFKKDGYYDSKPILSQQLPVNTNRIVWAFLEKIQAPKSGSAPPSENIYLGTGFLLNIEGNVLTNYHVVKECKAIEVDNVLFKSKAKVLFTDAINDLAVLITEKTPPLPISHLRRGKELRLGDDIITIGYPLDTILGESAKATKGNISSLTGIANDSRMFQISAPVQPGNSGGPLLDKSGNVVGIVSGKLSDLVTLKATGSLPQNVNFAIKSEFLQLFLNSHEVNYSSQNSDKSFDAADIVENAKKFTFQVQCLK